MAFNSFRPIRRFRISSLPAFVSKDQAEPFLRMGIGNGQSSFPTWRRTSSSPFFSREFFSS